VTAVADAIPALPGVQVLDYGSTGDPKFVTDDQRSTFVLVYAPQPRGFTDPLADAVDNTARAAAHKQGLDARLTGYSQLSAGNTESGGPSVPAETLIGALGALVVLAFVFASCLALVPLLIAAVAILTTFLLVLGLTTFTDVSFVVQFLIALIGLGVAIDSPCWWSPVGVRNAPRGRATTRPSSPRSGPRATRSSPPASRS
jgi:putative drug exporter of the RND superfamily